MVLVHALLCDLTLWDLQVERLAARFHVLRYDARGHGASALQAPFRFEDLADDLRTLLDGLGIDRAHIVGLSMGGVIARLFALRHPGRVDRLVLCSTMAALPAGVAETWHARAERVRTAGMGTVVEASLAHWFSAAALAARTAAVERVRTMAQRTSAEAYRAVCAAVPRLDFFGAQGTIDAPTLVLAGDADPNLPGLAPEALARTLPAADLHIFRDAGHFPNLERADEFNERVNAFLR